MQDRYAELKELGWSKWFEARAECAPGDTVARVAAVDRERLLLVDGAGAFRATLTGRYLYRHELSHELPCVGDWVCVDKQPGGDAGLVHALLERRRSLQRKSSGRAVEIQMIAANVDVAVIVQSCHYDFNVNRLERYLVMAADGGAEPRVLLTKTDLVGQAELQAQLAAIRAAGITAPVATLSNATGAGVDELEQSLQPGKTYCFAGSSGVGKSTLINRLLGREALDTQTVSGTGEGRHTTVRRELFRLRGGALVIDNPGMREFGILGADQGIDGGYPDIAALSAGCRYRDCTHAGDPGCAILEAVLSGDLAREHYDNYLKLRDESEFYGMSYVEKRKKDRAFGRFIKSAKKDLRRD